MNNTHHSLEYTDYRATSGKFPRVPLVDFLRGIALIGMTVFHFVYDLEHFGLRTTGYSSQFHWWLFATIVAGSFLVLTGVSLYLAHAEKIYWKSWLRRFIIIASCAMAITVITFYLMPGLTIYFGILHMIAIASIVGLAFLRISWLLTAIAAIGVLIIARYSYFLWLDQPIFSWIGLVSLAPVSADYRPVFPWLAAVLFGIAMARISHQAGWISYLSRLRFNNRLLNAIRFLGQYSLYYYLIHQPVLFLGFWIWLQLSY